MGRRRFTQSSNVGAWTWGGDLGVWGDHGTTEGRPAGDRGATTVCQVSQRGAPWKDHGTTEGDRGATAGRRRKSELEPELELELYLEVDLGLELEPKLALGAGRG